MTDIILTVYRLHKQYDREKAVDDVSLNIRQGEIFGLLGPNGAGKTTAISMMTGLFPPDEGTITVAGLDVQQQARAARQRIGLVPHDLALYPALSAWDNLIFFGRLYGLRGRPLRRRTGELLALVGLMFGVGVVVSDMSLGNSLPGLVLVTLATAAPAAGLGLLLAALGRTRERVNALGALLSIVLAALGGIFIPTFAMADWMQTLSDPPRLGPDRLPGRHRPRSGSLRRPRRGRRITPLRRPLLRHRPLAIPLRGLGRL